MKAKQIKEIIFDYLEGSNFNEINEIINIETSWKEIVGKTISQNTKIVSLKRGELTIKTMNPIWRNELSMQKKELLSKILSEKPKLKINKIRFI